MAHTSNLDSFDTDKADENWRQLASFGVERNQVSLILNEVDRILLLARANKILCFSLSLLSCS